MAIQPRSDKARQRRWSLAVLILVVTMALYPIRHDPANQLKKTGYETLELGNSIALHGSFSDPFALLATGPSAHEAPGYPAVVALIIDIFGVGPEGDYALHWLTRTVLAAQLALLPFLADYWGLNAITGAIAAIGWLIAEFPLSPGETDFASLLIIALGFPCTRLFAANFPGRFLLPPESPGDCCCY
jgi:hypothetical protein